MLDYTMFVVTTQADGEMSGCLVGFATQTSMHPPRFLAGISRVNHTCGVAARSDYLAVHVVERRHIGLARLFGGQTGDQVNKFDHCRGTLARTACRFSTTRWRGSSAGR